MYYRLVALMILVSGLSACASVENCIQTNWMALGLSDGAKGPGATIASDYYFSSCAGQGVQPDKLAYNAGFYHGQRQFCSVDWKQLVLDYNKQSDGSDGEYIPWGETEQGISVIRFCNAAGFDLKVGDLSDDTFRWCHSVDWFDLGYNSAFTGVFTAPMDEMPLKCKKLNISPDNKGFANGQTLGAQNFCTFDLGFDIGASDKERASICDAVQVPDFDLGYQQGIEAQKYLAQREYLIGQNQLLRGSIYNESLQKSAKKELRLKIAENTGEIENLNQLIDQLRY